MSALVESTVRAEYDQATKNTLAARDRIEMADRSLLRARVLMGEDRIYTASAAEDLLLGHLYEAEAHLARARAAIERARAAREQNGKGFV